MASKSRTEELIGGIVVAVLAIVLAYSYAKEQAPGAQGNGIVVSAEFGRTDGLRVGAEVRLSGISVGKVTDQDLSPSYRTVVRMELRGDLNIPTDSAAVIRTDGLMGAKYVELEPGGAMEGLASGGRIEYTQDAVVVEDLLSKIIEMAKANRAAGPPAPEDPTPGSTPDLMPGLAPDL